MSDRKQKFYKTQVFSLAMYPMYNGEKGLKVFAKLKLCPDQEITDDLNLIDGYFMGIFWFFFWTNKLY